MRFERILRLWDPANPQTIPDRAIDAETHRLMCHAMYRLFTKLFITKGFFPQARELAQKAEAYGPLPWGLRWAVRMPWAYRLLNSRKRRLAEAVYALQSRGFLKTLDSGDPPLRTLVADPQLREALGVETASDAS